MKRVAVTSLKGGVGKTTVTSAIALCLRDGGVPVAAVDCDLTNPCLHLLLGFPLAPLKMADRYQYLPAQRDGLAFASVAGMYTDRPVVIGVPTRNRARDIRAVLSGLQVPEARVVLYDTPPTSSEECMAVLLSGLDSLIVVTEGGEMGQAGLARSLNLATLLEVPLLMVVVNRYQEGQHLEWSLLKKAPVVYQVPDQGGRPLSEWYGNLGELATTVLEGSPRVLQHGGGVKRWLAELLRE